MASATTSITAYSGRDFLIKLADPTISPTSLNTLGGLRGGTLSINGNPVDITNVASSGYQEWLPDGGVFAFNVSGDGIYDGTGTGAQLANTASINRTYVECQVISGAGDSFVFDAVIENYERNGAFDDAEGFSISIASHGTVQYNAA